MRSGPGRQRARPPRWRTLGNWCATPPWRRRRSVGHPPTRSENLGSARPPRENGIVADCQSWPPCPYQLDRSSRCRDSTPNRSDGGHLLPPFAMFRGARDGDVQPQAAKRNLHGQTSCSCASRGRPQRSRLVPFDRACSSGRTKARRRHCAGVRALARFTDNSCSTTGNRCCRSTSRRRRCTGCRCST